MEHAPHNEFMMSNKWAKFQMVQEKCGLEQTKLNQRNTSKRYTWNNNSCYHISDKHHPNQVNILPWQESKHEILDFSSFLLSCHLWYYFKISNQFNLCKSKWKFQMFVRPQGFSRQHITSIYILQKLTMRGHSCSIPVAGSQLLLATALRLVSQAALPKQIVMWTL